MAGADQRPGEGGGRHRDRLARRERLPVHDGETVRHHHSLTLVSVPAALTRISAKLGVQTVINDPYEFKVRRRAGRRGRRTLEWHPLPKGVAHLQRYACPPRPTTTTSMPWPSSTTRPGSPCPRPPRAASARLPRPIVACLQPRDHPRPPPCSPLCSAGSTRSTAQPRRADAVVRASSGGRSPEQRAGLPPRQMPPPPQLVAKIPAPAAGASPSSATPF